MPGWIPTARGLALTSDRAGLQLDEQLQQIDPILTALVRGRGQRSVMLGQSIFRQIPVPNTTYQWLKIPHTHLVPIATERPMRADYAERDWKPTYETGKVVRHGFATRRDIDEYVNADNQLDLRVRDAMLSRMTVELDLELKRAALLIASGSYPVANVTTLAAGSEFNGVSGDSRAAIRVASAPIRTMFNVSYDQIAVHLSRESADAAMDDPTFLANKVNTSVAAPMETELASYWGVGRVVVGDALTAVDEATDPVSAYGDVAILSLIDNAPEFDTSHGVETFAAEFTKQSGVANAPFQREINSSIYWPWTAWAKAQFINNAAGALILNCAA